VIERQGGEIPKLYDGAVPHWDLAKKYDLIDFELGVKTRRRLSCTKEKAHVCNAL
jgi:hypothetical protein